VSGSDNTCSPENTPSAVRHRSTTFQLVAGERQGVSPPRIPITPQVVRSDGSRIDSTILEITMRPCVKCGAPIGNGDANCTECGAQQLPSVGVNPEKPVGRPAPDDTSSNEYALVSLLQMLAVLCVLAFPVATFLLFGPAAGFVVMFFVVIVCAVGMAVLNG